MARIFDEQRWSIYRDGNVVTSIEIIGTLLVVDSDGDSAAQEFSHTDDWVNVPANVKQAIVDAFQTYRAWIQQRRDSREL